MSKSGPLVIKVVDGIHSVVNLGCLKIIDLGVNNVLASTDGRKLKQWEGTMNYLAPEALVGTTITFESDLWYASCILYEIMTGLLPAFPGKKDDEIGRIVLTRAPTRFPAFYSVALKEMM